MQKLPFKMSKIAAAISAVLANNAMADSARLTNPDNSHVYQRLDTPANWNAAKITCSNLNGYLATVTSQQEQDWILTNFGSSNNMWLGATDEGHEGTWTWITGEPWSYTSWTPGQPDNYAGAENFLHTWSTGVGKWNDQSGGSLVQYLCEWDSPPTDLYNPNADFSITNGNPNGVWSYGWMPTNFSTFNVHDTSGFSGFNSWWNAPNTSSIWKNISQGSGYGVLPGQLSLHPGNGTEPSVLRFTAPTDGQYRVMGQFLAGDGGTMLVGVRQGNTWLWQGTNAGAFDLNPIVTANDTIDFTVYGGYGYGNTPLDVNILLTATNLLTVSKTGTGTGTITSTPAGIDCGSTCSAGFANETEVALEATPSANSSFEGWSEDSDPDCADGLVTTTDTSQTCTAVFNLIPPPSVVTNVPSVITSNTAKLQGTVNPNGAATNVTFEYSLPKTTVSGSPSTIDADAGATAVSANLTGLACKTAYTYHVIATNNVGGTTTGNDQAFTTAGCLVATTRPASSITRTSATLNGMVIPNAATTVSFDLGSTTSYGTSVPVVGTINTSTVVRSTKTGLTCGTTYNYRVKAVSAGTTVYGLNSSFKTLDCPPTPADLVVTSITPNPTAPIAFGTFNATVTVKNQGGSPATGAMVEVWANQTTAPTCGAFGDDGDFTSTLAPGASTTITVYDLPAGTPGAKMLRAFVDSDCSVVESNDTNNQGTAVYYVNQPSSTLDFAVTAIALNPIAPAVNGTFTATVTVKNLGAAADGKFLDVWTNQSALQPCSATGSSKHVAIGNLSAGASKAVSIPGLAAGSAGSKVFRAFVDSGCSIGEKLESNNQNTKAYVMNAPSCLAIKTATPTAPSGTYTLDPDGATGAIAPFSAYCDMTTDGGGWTLVARILGNSRTHVNVNAVGTLTASTQTTVAKLADATINAIGRSYYRITCNGLTDFLKYNNGWSSTASNNSTYWTGNNKAGDWAQAAAGSWLNNTYSSDSDVGGGSWPDYDGIQFNADGSNGCHQNGYGRDGVMWIK